MIICSYLQNDLKINIAFFGDVTRRAWSFWHFIAHVSDVGICLRSCETGLSLGIQTTALTTNCI